MGLIPVFRTLLTLCLLSLFGCIGDAAYKLPPLYVQGAILDRDGTPIPHLPVTIVDAPYYVSASDETIRAVKMGTLSATDGRYRFVEVRTDETGRFSASFPQRGRLVGVTPFSVGADREGESLHIAIRASEIPPFFIQIYGRKATLKAPDDDGKFLIEPPRSFPVTVSTDIRRSVDSDHISLTIRSK